MKIKIKEGETSRYVRVSFFSIFKAWLASFAVYVAVLILLGVLLMKFT